MIEKKEEDVEKNRVEALKKKVKFFYENHIPIHIILNSKRFYNGEVTQPPNADFFMLNDYVLGEQPIFFIQITEVEQFDTSQLSKYEVKKE